MMYVYIKGSQAPGDAPTAAATAAGSFWVALEKAIVERLTSRLQRTGEASDLSGLGHLKSSFLIIFSFKICTEERIMG